MQCLYYYVPETSSKFTVCNVTAILLLQFGVGVILFCMLKVLNFYISTLSNMCAVPSTAVFCSSLISLFPGIYY